MSAFIVQNDVINAVVTYLSGRNSQSIQRLILAETGHDIATRDGRIALGTAMHELNCHAVDARYGVGDSADCSYQYAGKIVDAVQAYKWLRCWLYQCTEGDVPDASLLYTTMEHASDALAHHIVSNLPRYEQAEW